MGFPRLLGDMLADDNGEIAVLSVSGLYMGNDGVDYRPFLDQLQAEGVEAVRWFASGLTASNTRTGCSVQNAEERAEHIAQALADRGMLGDAVGFCDTGSTLWTGGFDAHANWFGAFLKRFRHLIGEAVNEIGHDSQRQFSWGEIGALVERIRAAGYTGPLTAGAWIKGDELLNGEYPPAGIHGTDVIDTHFQRTNDPAWDMSNHGFAELRAIQEIYKGKARKSGEPKRTDDGVQPAGVFAYLLGVEAQGFNTWTTLHSSQLRDAQVLNGQQLSDLRTFLRAGKLLPRGRYHYENAGWGGSPVWNAAFCEWGPDKPSTNPNEKNVWRAHSYRHESTGQWFLVLSGPNVSRPFLEFQHGFSLDRKIDALNTHVEVWTLKQ